MELNSEVFCKKTAGVDNNIAMGLQLTRKLQLGILNPVSKACWLVSLSKC
jgi:hypothetical protein